MTNEKHNNLRSEQPPIRRTVIIIAIIAVFATGSAFLLKRLEHREDAAIIADSIDNSTYNDTYGLIRYGGKWYKQNPDITTLLLIGVDDVKDADEEKSRQSDFLFVVVMDRETNSYKALQINRDTMTDVPQLDMYGKEFGTAWQQIALAYAQGNSDVTNSKNTLRAVSNLLYGVNIDHFVCVPMDIVPVVNDLVGGVPVYVEDDFSGADPSIITGQTNTLQGSQALTFVRARQEMEDPTNLARMERQRTYVHALHQQTVKKAKSDEDFIIRSLLELAPYITSDCSTEQLTNFFDIALNQSETDIMTIQGEAVSGDEYVEFQVDEDALQQQVIEMFYVEDTANE
ncbi:MAG: LCP family protein [Lachnospiraceae bacterium]|nr:LCP family protein [Lachnospiraceae bacterium]